MDDVEPACERWIRRACQISPMSSMDVPGTRAELEQKMMREGCSFRELDCSNRGLMLLSLDKNPPLPLWLQNALTLSIILVAFITLVANLTVVWIILRHRVMRQRTTNRLVLNLAISDLSITLFNTIPLGLSNVYEEWILPNRLCPIGQMFGVTPFCASVFSMVVISIDRYFAILHPLEGRPWGLNNGRCYALTVLAIWSVALILGAPALFLNESFGNIFLVRERAKEVLDSTRTVCGSGKEAIKYNHFYNICLLLLQFVVPFGVLLFTYGRIARELWSAERTPDNNLREQFLMAKRRMAKLFALLVFSFLLLWLPYELLFAIPTSLFVGQSQIYWKVLLNISFLLAMSSTLVSPLVYYHMSERFRIGFRYAFRWALPRGARVTAQQYRDTFGLGGPRISHIFRNFPGQIGGASTRRQTCETTASGSSFGGNSAKGSVQLY